jgi:hypothetical protein
MPLADANGTAAVPFHTYFDTIARRGYVGVAWRLNRADLIHIVGKGSS